MDYVTQIKVGCIRKFYFDIKAHHTDHKLLSSNHFNVPLFSDT